MTTRTTQASAAAAMRAMAPAASRQSFDRAAWERSVMASDIHPHARLVAFLLAHHADTGGRIEAGGPQHAERLAEVSGLLGRFVRVSLNQLEERHFIRRPSMAEWPDVYQVRPVTLTVPPSTAEPR